MFLSNIINSTHIRYYVEFLEISNCFPTFSHLKPPIVGDQSPKAKATAKA